MGGSSSERPVSLSTGKMIVKALDSERYAVVGIDTQEILALSGAARPAIAADAAPGSQELTQEASTPATFGRPDIVFIALHGKGGEDGTIQGVLEFLGIPYTGSGILASALAMDKSAAKRLFSAYGVPVASSITLRRSESLDLPALVEKIESALGGFPVFVKPNAEGSSFGGSLVETEDKLEAAVKNALTYDPLVIVEQYLRGTEITVGVLGNAGEALQALPAVEIVPKSAYYDFESKYADGGSDHIIPARLTESMSARVAETAKICHEALGCRGMSRTDMIVCDDRLFVLEVNTIPGMTPTSLLPQAAEHVGISFPALLNRLIDLALPREQI
jgi:D-alanine-D-alanine ligase